MATGGMLSPAAVLDACALYGRSNPSLVADLLRSLGELDDGAVGVILGEGLEEAGLAAARALGDVHAKVGFFIFCFTSFFIYTAPKKGPLWSWRKPVSTTEFYDLGFYDRPRLIYTNRQICYLPGYIVIRTKYC